MHTPETHLIPILTSKILRSQIFKIYGSNYNTKDGTCIRDYIHIKDLCVALYLAIKRINNKDIKEIINLGTGKGFTVLEILKSILKKVEKKNKFSYFFSSERSGDSSKLVCSNKKAFRILKWKPRYSNLNKILNDELMWQKFLNLKKIKKINKY
jgi:UDP-glucose 4-epimerase